jgi:hypothetical protein
LLGADGRYPPQEIKNIEKIKISGTGIILFMALQGCIIKKLS